MPMRRVLCRQFHRRLFGGQMQKIQLLKRGDDQAEGTVVSLILFQCRHSLIVKTGEPLAGDMASGSRTVWHIPRTELDRVGVAYLNAGDRIREIDGPNSGRVWMPESTDEITVKLFATHLDVMCTELT